VRHLNGEVCEMQTATTGRMSTAVKSGVQALESRMPGKRAPHHPMFDPSRRDREVRKTRPPGHPPHLDAKARGESSMVGKHEMYRRRLGHGRARPA